MKVIGLIGGMSWNSSLEYYRFINQFVAQKLGGLHSARIILYSLDFDEVERAQSEARWDDAANILAEAGRALKLAGADFLVICTNTMHKVAEQVSGSAGLPLLHIGDVTAQAINERGLSKVGLLGTQFIMKEQFYQSRLQNFGIKVLVPPEGEQARVHRIIYQELCQGKIRGSSRRSCINIIAGLMGQGAEGVVLGCTELPLLIQPGELSVPLFDTTRLHAQAAAKLALTD